MASFDSAEGGDGETLEKLQREADVAAIREGIADMEAGRILTIEQLDARIHATLSAHAEK